MRLVRQMALHTVFGLRETIDPVRRGIERTHLCVTRRAVALLIEHDSMHALEMCIPLALVQKLR